jgi:serine/threonine protein kinase/tetratricopeptide (TPR) repeat protein
MREHFLRFSAGELVAENYRILEVAGVGGMGTVLRAFDERLQRTVALKFLPAEMGINSSDKERLLREARTTSALDHPNLGAVYGIEQTPEDHTFLVMPFYAGGSLTEWVRGRHPSLTEKLQLAMQIASGLGEAHAHGIVHRDIKPSNIMMTSEGVPKIVDFGLAYLLTGETVSRTETTGTVAYMAPEQALGRPVDGRSDIWALGVVMAEMLTGRHPFYRETLAGILYAILHDPPQHLEGLAPDLQTILFRMLSKDPASRYGSCAVLMQDIETLLAQSPAPDQPSLPPSGRGQTQLRRVRDSASRPALADTGSSRLRTRRWAVAAAILIAAGLTAWFVPGIRQALPKPFASAAAVQHIAVLPFTGSANSPDQAALAAGLMESLTDRLANLSGSNPSLWVVPASEVRRRNITDPEVALKDLGTNLVVEGKVQQSGDSTDLQFELIDTSQMRELGSVTLHSAKGDVATLESRAVDRLARMMHAHTPAMPSHPSGISAKPEAYQDYLTALGYIQRYDQPGHLESAIHILHQAVKVDPGFALGYAELAEASRLEYQTTKNIAWLKEAGQQANRSRQLDSTLPAAWVILGRVHDLTDKPDLALVEYQQALKLDPHSAAAIEGLGHTYESEGRIADAQAAYVRAANIAPQNWDGFNSLGGFYDRHGKFKQAIAAFQRALDLTPDNAEVLLNLGAVYLDTGDSKLLPLAEESLRHSLALDPTYPAYVNLGVAYAEQSRFRKSIEVTRKALAINSNDYMVWLSLLSDYESLGMGQQAAGVRAHMVPLMEQAIKDRPQNATTHALLADVYAGQQKRQLALAQLEIALTLSPEDPLTIASAADVYANLHEPQQSIRYIKLALRKGLPVEQLRSDPELAVELQSQTVKSLLRKKQRS